MELSDIPLAAKYLGARDIVKLLTSRRRFRRFLPAESALRLKGYEFPFHFRHVTTDKYVIAEVLFRRQYECLLNLPNVRTIVDAGANIGTTAVFLLNAYPRARLIALEPDPGNFAILEKNLSYYGPRAIALRRALWHRPEPLAIKRGSFRDGGEWSIQVDSIEGRAAGEVEGMTISDVITSYKLPTIDILKIDIEGAERAVFEEAPRAGWLDHVHTLAVELHDSPSRHAFAQATSSRRGHTSHVGEVTIWRSET